MGRLCVIQKRRKTTVRIVTAKKRLFEEAAERVLALARRAVLHRGRFILGLSGGSTPNELYRLMARSGYARKFPWRKTYFFWGDERWVRQRSRRNNYGNFARIMRRIRIPDRNLFPVDTRLESPQRSAVDYERRLVSLFEIRKGQKPRFDLILLGMGADGHTASLFPGSSALKESSRFTAATRLRTSREWRITFTFPVINHARHVLFLVTGVAKSSAVSRVLRKGNGRALPAQRVNPKKGHLFWYLDADAASKIPVRT